MEKQVDHFSKKLKIELLYDLEYKPRRIGRKVLKRYWKMHVIMALFSTAKKWRRPSVHW